MVVRRARQRLRRWTSQEPDSDHSSAGAWAKKLYLASRAIMDSVLRQYDLGSTQWYVLYQLANDGPTRQREA